MVGGTTNGAGNVISGTGNGITGAATIEGNLIGINPNGPGDCGNGGDSIYVSGQSVIGRTAVGAVNIIAGNGSNGIVLFGTTFGQYTENSSADGTMIEGNLIGGDSTGTLYNGDGILVKNTSNISIGGLDAAAGNVMLFNGHAGIEISGADTGFLREGRGY